MKILPIPQNIAHIAPTKHNYSSAIVFRTLFAVCNECAMQIYAFISVINID